MRRINAIALGIIFLCTVSALAQKEESTYNDLVAKVKSGDASVTLKDFAAMRIAFSKTKAYSPYGGDREGRKAAFDSIEKKKYKDAVKKANDMLKDDYVNMDAHVAASLGYEGLGDKAKAEFHKNVYLGLVNSILTSGDGKTAKTAYVVIATGEEYTVLKALNLFPSGQALENVDGHAFDVMTAIDPKTKESLKIFFNIDIPWKAQMDIFK